MAASWKQRRLTKPRPTLSQRSDRRVTGFARFHSQIVVHPSWIGRANYRGNWIKPNLSICPKISTTKFSNLDRIHPFGLYDLTVKSCIPNFFKLENLKLQFYTFVPVKLYDVKLDARKVFSLQNWRNYNTFRNVGQRSFFEGYRNWLIINLQIVKIV